MEDTIVAIATPLGEGGLGVVRLSGPNALPIASSLFKSSGALLRDAPSHTLHHGWIENDGHKIDDVVASVFRTPKSYTGEDVVEFSCHGSPLILKQLLDLCEKRGARLAGPGEFTQRAYLNGKMDLSQAEAVADLIAAQSDKARAVALDQLQGRLSKEIRNLRDPLIHLLARLEANLDFAEEDIPALPKEELEKEMKEIVKRLDQLLATKARGQILRHGLRVVLVGRPNVGKSSLFNALLATDRAIVTQHAGTTRDTLEEHVQWDGLSVLLIDTAGLRSTEEPIEKEGTDRTRRAQSQSDLLLWVLDGSEGMTPADEMVVADHKNKPVVAVLNKADKKIKVTASKIKSICKEATVVKTSAHKGTGLAALQNQVTKLAQSHAPEVEGVPVVTRLRHVHHLEAARAHLQKALASVRAKWSEEALSVDLRTALNELGAITGESVTEDVLSSIFRQFCIGK